MLAEVHQCVLFKVPLTRLSLVLDRSGHLLCFSSHVTNVVGPKIVPVQQLVGESTVSGLLRGLDDREGIKREENLSELLPHLRPVDEEARSKGAKSFGVRANYGPSQKDEASHNHLIIMREMCAPHDTSLGSTAAKGGTRRSR